MIREAIEIFGGMKPLEILKIVVPCVIRRSHKR